MSTSALMLKRLYEQKAAHCRRLAASASPYSVLALETLAADFARKAAAVAPGDATLRSTIVDEERLGRAGRALRCPDCGVAVTTTALLLAPVFECRVCGHVIIRAKQEHGAAPHETTLYETHSVNELAMTLGWHEVWVKTGGRKGKRAVLVQSDLSKRPLARARLPLAILAGARLQGANLDGAGLAVSDFGGADLSSASLVAADLRGANLENANLDEADLSTARLSPLRHVGESAVSLPARLGNAKLRGARLAGVDFRGANLAGADFTSADLRDADFRFARLDGMNVAGAKLDGVRW
jgi:Pentapeptide repeats (8 copies)